MKSVTVVGLLVLISIIAALAYAGQGDWTKGIHVTIEKISTEPCTTKASCPYVSIINEPYTAEEVAAYIKETHNTDYRSLAKANAKEAEVQLVPGPEKANRKWDVEIRARRGDDILSEDRITITEGHWNVLEVEGIRRFVFLISRVDKEDQLFYSFACDYYVENGVFMPSCSNWDVIPSSHASILSDNDPHIPNDLDVSVVFSARRLASHPASQPTTRP